MSKMIGKMMSKMIHLYLVFVKYAIYSYNDFLWINKRTKELNKGINYCKSVYIW